MLFENTQLADDFFPFRILRDCLSSRHISDIDGHIPLEWWTSVLASLLRCTQGIRQALAASPQIGSDMCVSKHP
jgi:hypothetical protein